MKVSGDQTPIQLDAYLNKVQPSKQKPGENQGPSKTQANSDPVKLSSKAMALQQAAQSLSADESDRAEKVAQVKMEVEKGTYTVDAPKVATGMISEAFENNMIMNKIDTHA